MRAWSRIPTRRASVGFSVRSEFPQHFGTGARGTSSRLIARRHVIVRLCFSKTSKAQDPAPSGTDGCKLLGFKGLGLPSGLTFPGNWAVGGFRVSRCCLYPSFHRLTTRRRSFAVNVGQVAGFRSKTSGTYSYLMVATWSSNLNAILPENSEPWESLSSLEATGRDVAALSHALRATPAPPLAEALHHLPAEEPIVWGMGLSSRAVPFRLPQEGARLVAFNMAIDRCAKAPLKLGNKSSVIRRPRLS